MANLKGTKGGKTPTVEGAVTFSKYLQQDIVAVTHQETVYLKNMLDGIRNINNALPTSMAMFVAKNLKKINALIDKLGIKKGEIEKEFIEVDSKGRFLYWDKQEKRTNAEGQEVPDNEQAINGIKAYYNYQIGQLIDTFTGKPVLEGKQKELVYYITSEEKENAFQDKMEAHMTSKNEIHVTRVDSNYMEDTRVALPTRIHLPGAKTPIETNMVTFFDYLVIGGGATSEN
jgi:hypothetical protein